MKGVTLNVALATVVFFVITLVWQQDVFGAAFSAVVFALTYGAIQVGLVMFRGEDS